jgi:excisionase family DNA binding protein
MMERNQTLSNQVAGRIAVAAPLYEMTDTRTTSPTSRGMFTIQNFCEWSGLCRTHVYALIKRGDLTPVKCGRRTLIPTDEVLRWRGALPALRMPIAPGERQR